MLSFPSSLQSSLLQDKQNTNPNFKTTKDSDPSPSNIKKYKAASKSVELSLYQIDNQNSQRKQQTSCPNTNNSLKHLLKQFDQAILQNYRNQEEESNQDHQAQQKLNKVMEIGENDQQYQIDCKVKWSEQSMQRKSRATRISEKICNLKQQLLTNLGKIKVYQICQYLDQSLPLTNEQEQIISILFNHFSYDFEIQSHTLIKQYQMYLEQNKQNKDKLKKLQAEFNCLKIKKIDPKLVSDHFRLQLANSFSYYSQNGGIINYTSLCKVFQNILTKPQIATIFCYAYSMETKLIMTLLDPTQNVNCQFLLANIFGNKRAPASSPKFQQINQRYLASAHYQNAHKFKQMETKYAQNIKNKDNEIQKLKRIIDFMKIEKEAQMSKYRQIMRNKEAAFKQQYNKKIEKLINSKKQQRQLTEWYQNELQAVVKQVNRENVIRKFLHHS